MSTPPHMEAAPGQTRLVLVRHGETVWHHVNRYAGGNSDIDLTPLGARQAGHLARWAADQDFVAVVSSPVRRAVETARPCADLLGLPVEIAPGLREVDFGIAEGRTASELWTMDAEMMDRFRSDPVAHPFPGAESPAAGAGRAARALTSIAHAYPSDRVLVVAHNTLLRLGICALLDIPIARYRKVFPRLDNAAVSEIAVGLGQPTIVSLLKLNMPTAPLQDGGPPDPLSAADLRQRPPTQRKQT